MTQPRNILATPVRLPHLFDIPASDNLSFFGVPFLALLPAFLSGVPNCWASVFSLLRIMIYIVFQVMVFCS